MMGVYTRPDSPYYWLWLKRAGQPGLRVNTNIPIAGVTPAQEKENRALAEAAYIAKMGDLARDRFELPGAPEPEVITFATYAVWYERHHSSKHRGTVRERQLLAHLLAFFSTRPLPEITRMRAQEYLTRR